MAEVDASRHIWVTRLIDAGRKRTVDRPLLVGCLSLGLVPIALTLVVLALSVGRPPIGFLTAHLLAAAVPFVAPAAIWYWDTQVYPQFVTRSADIATDPDEVRRIAAEYKAVLCDDYLYFTVP